MQPASCHTDLSLLSACFSPVMAPVFLHRLVMAKLQECLEKTREYGRESASKYGEKPKNRQIRLFRRDRFAPDAVHHQPISRIWDVPGDGG